jgi:hypothetical protein
VHKWKNIEYRFWFGLTTISQNPTDWIWCKIRRNEQYKSGSQFWYPSRKYTYTLIRQTVQKLWSLQVGGSARTSDLNQWCNFLTLRFGLNWSKIGGNSEYWSRKEFHNLSKERRNSEFWYQTKKPWSVEVNQILEIWLWIGNDFWFFLSFFWFLIFASWCNMSVLYVPRQKKKACPI